MLVSFIYKRYRLYIAYLSCASCQTTVQREGSRGIVMLGPKQATVYCLVLVRVVPMHTQMGYRIYYNDVRYGVVQLG